ncbi:uncharacterized protein [Blastocystis hominis]|uniref:Phosphate transporter n=1 Tax=Blastocystis hominis TaxID=12968 RepID=D8LXU1_BLAHO|nr:uncharacterized protein [Blastocystis hominis]CBK20396.2 unnamed protein product [Blastocystis hominis]|eukprot:XP_012894444.1 uncharacterized protein [Blastocystis hominis]
MITYTWIPWFTGVVAFVMAYGIGANDVANAFATSVGAKAITLKQALLIAAFMEFFGATLMGSHVTDTIAKGIIDAELFTEEPEILMVAEMCALMSASVWLLLATIWGLPVSTTHSIIGALVQSVLSGILTFLLFLFVRNCILRAKESFERALKFYPIMVGVTFAVNIFFIIYKGSPQLNLDETPLWLGLLISVVLGVIISVVLTFTMVPCLRKRSLKIQTEEDNAKAQPTKSVSANPDAPMAAANTAVTVSVPVEETKKETKATKDALGVLNQDVHAELKDEESQVYKMHKNAEKFDARTEHVFTFVQVVTATFDSFSHGANDVANSIGPFAGVVSIYVNRGISDKSEVPIWILILGGAGIVAGLATLGYKIIASIGVNLVRVTPSRGFTIELGAAIVVLIGSRLGIPLSTTHCQVGSTVGVGILEGKKGINWKLFLEVFVGWVLTLVVAALMAAGFLWFAMGTPTMLVPFK